jgi:hypothetical protein
MDDFPDSLRVELDHYFNQVLADAGPNENQEHWVASSLRADDLPNGHHGLRWHLVSNGGKSINVILDPELLESPNSVPNESSLSDLAWYITILAQEHVLSYPVDSFENNESIVLRHEGRREPR